MAKLVFIFDLNGFCSEILRTFGVKFINWNEFFVRYEAKSAICRQLFDLNDCFKSRIQFNLKIIGYLKRIFVRYKANFSPDMKRFFYQRHNFQFEANIWVWIQGKSAMIFHIWRDFLAICYKNVSVIYDLKRIFSPIWKWHFLRSDI